MIAGSILVASTACTWFIAHGASIRWRMLFRIFCHGIPDRCFYVWHVPMPICARCVAIYGGLAAGIAIFWIAPIFVGHKLGAPKNRAGWAWGLLLGWIGVIIVACLSDKNPKVTAMTERQREVAELEAEIKLAELRKQHAALVSK